MEGQGERCSDWIQLQKYIKITQLLCAHGENYLEEADTQRLIAQLKTQVKDYFFHKLGLQPRWQHEPHASKQPVLSENSRFVFCAGSHDAHRFLNEFIFALRNDPQIFKAVLSLWPRDSANLELAVEAFAELFFEDVVSAENYEYELLRAVGNVVELGEHLGKDGVLREDTILGGFLKSYMRRPAIVQYMRAVYQSPLLEIIYNVATELEIASSKICQNIKSFRVEFLTTGSNSRGRISEPMRLPNRLTSSTDVSGNPFFVSIPEDENGEADINTEESVQAVLRDVSEKLTSTCQLLLDSLFSKVSEAPYGLRWLCNAINQSCVQCHYSSQQCASLLGSLLIPSWETYIFQVLGVIHISSLSPLCRSNLSVVETMIRSVVEGRKSDNPDFRYVNAFVEEQQ